MSYYKHIKTVQAFQLGNIIPIAPIFLVGRPLVYQPEDLSQDSQYRSHLLGPKKSSKKLPLYIDKIPSYVAPVNRKVTKVLLLRYLLIKTVKKSRL
jgi:hypothetical protein